MNDHIPHNVQVVLSIVNSIPFIKKNTKIMQRELVNRNGSSVLDLFIKLPHAFELRMNVIWGFHNGPICRITADGISCTITYEDGKWVSAMMPDWLERLEMYVNERVSDLPVKIEKIKNDLKLLKKVKQL